MSQEKISKNKEKEWVIPVNVDCNKSILDPNGLFIYCTICDTKVKSRIGRPYTFSRWIDHLTCNRHLKNESQHCHQKTIKSKEINKTELSKGDHANLRRQIGIQSFFNPKKKRNVDVINEDSIVVYEPNKNKIGTAKIETSRVGTSC